VHCRYPTDLENLESPVMEENVVAEEEVPRFLEVLRRFDEALTRGIRSSKSSNVDRVALAVRPLVSIGRK